ncbi:MAG: O-antigen ligase family protein [Ferruginibacter sp.]
MAKQKNIPQQKTASVSKHLKPVSNAMMAWLSVYAAIISVALSSVTVEPTISVRYMITGLFCLGFVVYFFMIKKDELPAQYPLPIKMVFGAGILYFVWSMISLNFAVNAAAGLYELLRILLNLVLLFIIIETIRRSVEKISLLVKVIIVVSIVHSIIGILQFYGIGFLNIPGANQQPYGLMANRNLYGSAQALTIPFLLYACFSSTSKWKIAALSAMGLVTISILLSQTRSAWLASAVSLIVGFILVFIFAKEKRKDLLKSTGIGLVAAIIIIGFILFVNKQTGVTNTISERALSFTTGSNASTESAENVNARFLIWKKTAELIKDKPVFGAGLSNWKLTIASYGAADMPWKVGDFVPDRPHNVYLQVMAESGIPGFIFFIMMWIIVVIAGFKTLQKNIPVDEKILVALMLAGIAGFATDCMFSFPTERIEHSFYLLLMSGIILGMYIKTISGADQRIRLIPPYLKWLMAIIALLNIFMAYQKYNFESSFNIAVALEKDGNFAEEIEVANSGKSSWVTVDPEGQSMEMRTGIAYKSMKNYDMAIKEMQQGRRYNPHSPALLSNLGSVYTDMQDFKTAISYFEQSLKYAPAFQVALINIAGNQYELGNYQATLSALEKVDFNKYPKVRELQNMAKRKLLESK